MSRLQSLLRQAQPLERHEISDLRSWLNVLRGDCELFGETAEDAARIAEIEARIAKEDKDGENAGD